MDHLGDTGSFPYKCPVDGCGYASVQQSSVQTHVKGTHKLEWTEELVLLWTWVCETKAKLQKAASVHLENKAVLSAIIDGAKQGSSAGNAADASGQWEPVKPEEP